MLSKWLLSGLVLLLFCPQAVNAAQFSGDYLIQVCGHDENGKEHVPGGHIACQAYIAGLLDYHNLIRVLGTAPGVDFCVPEGVSLYALQNDVYLYLLKNKNEHGKFIASPGVALGLFEKYPCKKVKTPD